MRESLIFLRENFHWLHYVLVEYKLLYLDLWSIVHFWSGGLLFALLSAFNCKNRWKWLFIIVTGFEILEATFFIGVLKLFMPEKIPDVFMDIILGMAGGYWVYLMFEKGKINEKIKQHILILITTAVIAFFWTGFYSYQLNIHSEPAVSLNGTVVLFWWFTGYLLLLIFRKLQTKFNNGFYSMLAISVLFYVFLIPFYFLISEVLNIREISHEHNVIIGSLISLNLSLINFYLIFPILLVSVYSWLSHLSRKMTLTITSYDKKSSVHFNYSASCSTRFDSLR